MEMEISKEGSMALEWFASDKPESGNYNQEYKQLAALFQLLKWLTDFKLWCLLRCVIFATECGIY